jgi:hypothetical protein
LTCLLGHESREKPIKRSELSRSHLATASIKKNYKIGLSFFVEFDDGCPSDYKEQQKKRIRSLEVVYPTVILLTVGVKRYPKSVNNF